MNWNSASEFFAMGGYGLYVWGSFGANLLIFAAEFVLLARRRQSILRGLRREVMAERLETETA